MSKKEAATITAAAAAEQETAGEAAFDKEEGVRQKRADRKHAYDTIDQMSGLVAQGGSWMKMYLDVQSRFPGYSAGNALLLCAQKPDAVRVADAKNWNAMGVNIRKGESGIVIHPGGREQPPVLQPQEGVRRLPDDGEGHLRTGDPQGRTAPDQGARLRSALRRDDGRRIPPPRVGMRGIRP